MKIKSITLSILCLVSFLAISCKNNDKKEDNTNIEYETEEMITEVVEPETEEADSDSSIVLDLKLVNSFDVDGMIILTFTNDKGEEFQFNSIEESLINTYFKTNEDNETILLPEFLNKKFKVSYISKKVTNEEYEANGEDGEYIENHILKMTIINSNNNS